MTFWRKLRALAVACSIALLVAVLCALLSEDAPQRLEIHRTNTFIEK